MDTWPAARLMMAEGIKNGEILRGPPSSSALCSRSIVVNPPMPDAMNTPTRGPSAGVTSSCESSIANCDASNLVIVLTPLQPAFSACQLASVPIPSDDTRPMPVTTTRRVLVMSLLFGLGVRLDVLDGFLHARDLLGILVRNLDAELFLERHHELHGVERVGAQIVDKRRVRRHLFFVDSEL